MRQPTAVDVTAELVANVLSVAVSPGARVSVGDELVLLESMKMEIPVLAEQDGEVTEVAVEVGDVVQDGTVLLRLAGAVTEGYTRSTP